MNKLQLASWMTLMLIGFRGDGIVQPNPPNLGYQAAPKERISSCLVYGHGVRLNCPKLRRFVEADSLSPFGPGGLSHYAYVSDNVINRSDKTGYMEQASKDNVINRSDKTGYMEQASKHEGNQPPLSLMELSGLVIDKRFDTNIGINPDKDPFLVHFWGTHEKIRNKVSQLPLPESIQEYMRNLILGQSKEKFLEGGNELYKDKVLDHLSARIFNNGFYYIKNGKKVRYSPFDVHFAVYELAAAVYAYSRRTFDHHSIDSLFKLINDHIYLGSSSGDFYTRFPNYEDFDLNPNVSFDTFGFTRLISYKPFWDQLKETERRRREKFDESLLRGLRDENRETNSRFTCTIL